MRPEISNLITGSIYEELFNHERVKSFEGVKGVVRSLFFVDHNEKEDNVRLKYFFCYFESFNQFDYDFVGCGPRQQVE